MIGLIGGSGLDDLEPLDLERETAVDTPYGPASAPIAIGNFAGAPVAFLARHGREHRIPPHRINYRANLWAFDQLGIREIVAIAAVGGISSTMRPGSLVLPHDLIDYTWGRAHSYSDSADDALRHVELDPPYSTALRTRLIDAADEAGIELVALAVYAATQGPRLETAAEIRRLARDGCDVVGMTGMPEAALAAELGLSYACLAVVVNWAAGVGSGLIHAEIEHHISTGMARARALLAAALGQHAPAPGGD